MEGGRLDAAAREYAASTSRGQALRILAGSIFGAALFLRGSNAFGEGNPGHPVTPAKPCKKHDDCSGGEVCANGVCRTACDCADLDARITRLEQVCANGCGPSGCTSAATCPQPAPGSCKHATCTNGVCGFANDPVGTACPGGTCDGNGHCGGGGGCTSPATCPQAAAGSCQRATCTNGVCGFAPDDTNLPTCGPCQAATCTAGVPTCVNSAVGTACSSGGGTVCDGAGHCVQCVTADQCPGTDSVCAQRTCTAGTCGMTFLPNGTVCPGGNCDGQGVCVQSNPCTGFNCPPQAPICAGNIAIQYGNGICSSQGGVPVCTYPPTQQDCTPYVCSGGTCRTSCASNADCAAGFHCAGNVCVAGP